MGYYSILVIVECCNRTEMLSVVLILKDDCDPVVVKKHATIFLAAEHTFSRLYSEWMCLLPWWNKHISNTEQEYWQTILQENFNQGNSTQNTLHDRHSSSYVIFRWIYFSSIARILEFSGDSLSFI